MKTCSEKCEACCDFCITYRNYYDIDVDNDHSNTGFGLCLAHSEIMFFDWGNGCDDFYCRTARQLREAEQGIAIANCISYNEPHGS